VPSRLGIELSSTGCRVVEIDGRLDLKRGHSETRVTAFAMLPTHGPELTARLASLHGRRATAVVWARGADHRPVVVADGVYDQMRAEARAAVEAAGRTTPNALADIAPRAGSTSAGSKPSNVARRRTVVVASAPALEVATLLRPLVDAGIRIDHVLTPAAALLSLARTRKTLRRTGAIEAFEIYVALDEDEGSVAVVRDGTLAAATGLGWGFVQEHGGHRALRERGDIVERLSNELSTFLTEGGLDSAQVQHVCIASGVPELRSMAMALMPRLDVEVEPLDSTFAIDETRLPENADECREHLPALRLAWAAAADDRPPLDLLRPRRRQAQRARVATAAVISGLAAGLVLGVALQRQIHSEPPARPMAVLKASAFPLEVVSRPVARPDGPTSAAAQPRRVFRPSKEPEFPPPSLDGNDSEPEGERISIARPDDPPSPFDARLESVLVGSDRRAALIDGRVVERGDVVRGARIVEINAGEVMLRDERGRLRRLAPSGTRR
jgi:hypothetical protein